MRVAQVLRKLNPAEWSGTEMAVQRLLEGLRAQGIDPVVYCPRLAGANGHDDPFVRSGFEVQRFRAFVPVLGMPRERKRQLVAVGGNLMSFGLVTSLWRDRDISLVHTHTLGRLGGIALTVAKRRQVPFVVTIHGGAFDLPDKLKQTFNAPLDKGWEWGKLFGLLFQAHRLFRDADAILTCNPKEAALLEQRLPGKRIVVQPHGVPVELYRRDHRAAAGAAFPQLKGRQVLLCLGRIDPVKNQRWLIERAPELFRRHPEAVLVLVGPSTDEPYGNEISERIRRDGLDGRVVLTGGFPANDPRVIGLMQSAQALLVPSLSETFGLVILEAWAAGLAVITTRASGPAALVKDGENGFFFDLERPEGFYQVVDRLLEDRAVGARLAQNGGRVAERFSIEELAARVKTLYQHLIEEKQCAT